MDTDKIKQEYDQVEAELNTLRTQYKTLGNEIISLNNKAQKLYERLENQIILSFLDASMCYVNGRESTVRCDKCEEYLNKYNSRLNEDVRFQAFGYNPKTLQRTFQVRVKNKAKDTNLHNAVLPLFEIFGIVMPSENEFESILPSLNKIKYISVMAPDLSQYDTYDIVTDEKCTEYYFISSRYHRIILKSNNLLDILKYIRKHHGMSY